MIAWLVSMLQQNAELAIFLALAIGYLVGPLKIAGFNLGNVTTTLLAGVLVGQLNIPIPGPLKAFVFLLFLFAVGYKVGPQFFAGLRRDGAAQIVFAAFTCLVMLAVVTAFATIVHFNVGEACRSSVRFAHAVGGDWNRERRDRPPSAGSRGNEDAAGSDRHWVRRGVRPRHHHRRAGLFAARAGSLPL